MAITLEAGLGLVLTLIHRDGVAAVAARGAGRPNLCAGVVLGAFGLTEPDAGSDAGGTETQATLDGGEAGDRRGEKRASSHELGHADHVDRHDHGADRTGGALDASSCWLAPRFKRAAAVPQDGRGRPSQILMPDVRRLLGAGGRRAGVGAARRWVRRVPQGAGRGPGGLVSPRRGGAGVIQRGAGPTRRGLRQGTACPRPIGRHQVGGVPARRSGGVAGGGAAGGVSKRLAARQVCG